MSVRYPLPPLPLNWLIEIPNPTHTMPKPRPYERVSPTRHGETPLDRQCRVQCLDQVASTPTDRRTKQLQIRWRRVERVPVLPMISVARAEPAAHLALLVPVFRITFSRCGIGVTLLLLSEPRPFRPDHDHPPFDSLRMIDTRDALPYASRCSPR